MALPGAVDSASGDFSAWLKEKFPMGSKVWNVINRDTALADAMTSGNQVPFGGSFVSDGLYLKFPGVTEAGANTAVPFGEYTPMANPGKVEVNSIRCNVTSMNHSLRFTGFALDEFDGGDASVQNAFDLQMLQRVEDARVSFGRQLADDGSGRFGVLSAISNSGGTFTITNDRGILKGDEFDIRDDAAGTLYNDSGSVFSSTLAGKVTSITSRTVQTNGLTTTVFNATYDDGSPISLPNDSTISGYTVYRYRAQGLSINGLGIICSNANPTNWGPLNSGYFMGTDASANEWHQAYVFNCDTSGGSTPQILSIQNHLEPFLDAFRRRAGFLMPQSLNNGTADVVWMGFTGSQNIRAVANACKLNERYQGEQFMFMKKYPAFNFEGLLLVREHFVNPSEILCAYMPDLYRYERRPWFWDTRTGATWQRDRDPATGRDIDSFRMRALCRQQVACIRRKTQGKLYNLAATA